MVISSARFSIFEIFIDILCRVPIATTGAGFLVGSGAASFASTLTTFGSATFFSTSLASTTWFSVSFISFSMIGSETVGAVRSVAIQVLISSHGATKVNAITIEESTKASVVHFSASGQCCHASLEKIVCDTL